jgi:hypothetical protein
MIGWRRSADRTRLQPNSLLTGNLTGKIAFPGYLQAVSVCEIAAPQWFFE